MALSGDGKIALISAKEYSSEQQGTVYVFASDGKRWSQQQELTKPNDFHGNTAFGHSVSLSADGKTALINATEWVSDNCCLEVAYLYTWSQTGWLQTKKFIPSDGSGNDTGVGWLSVDGKIALIESFYQTFYQSGKAFVSAIYVFTNNGTGWAQQQKIVPPDGPADNFFGISTALSGDDKTMILGAPKLLGTSYISDGNRGAVYVFTYDGMDWIQQHVLTDKDGQADDGFGDSVLISADGNTVLVGAFWRMIRDKQVPESYVFIR